MYHLREDVLIQLKQAHLIVNPEKVKFCVQQISFLGHLVSPSGLSIDSECTCTLRSFSQPKNVRGVAHFTDILNSLRNSYLIFRTLRILKST